MAGEPEVADVGVLAVLGRGDEDVAGLHVAVDEPGLVGGVEGSGGLRDEVDRPFGVEPAVLAQDLAQIGALDELHRQVQATLSSPEATVRTMFGWCRPAAICDSRRKRRRNRSSCASESSRSFSATTCPSSPQARYTSAIAPRPTDDSTRNPATTVPGDSLAAITSAEHGTELPASSRRGDKLGRMSYPDTTLERGAARDEARVLFGQTMGLVAVTAGLFAVGAYLGREHVLPGRASSGSSSRSCACSA